MNKVERARIELDPTGFNEIKVCRHGVMVYNKNDIYVGGSLKKYGEFSWFEEELFRQLVGAGQLVVEVGANIGTHTIPLSRLVGSGGAVVAFEPQRLVFQALCANLALNQCINVFAFHQALSSKSGELMVPSLDPSKAANFGSVSLLSQHAGEAVPARPLDDMGLKACHFLKADVEGMELEVLMGAQATIRRFRPVMYLENDREEHSKPLLERVFSFDYTPYWHLPPLFNPNNFSGDQENIFPGVGSVNILCVPAESKSVLTGFRKVLSPEDHWQRALEVQKRG